MKGFLLLVGSMEVILSTTAFLGLFVVRKKKALVLLSIFAFSFIWRCISRFPSSRYYCIFIVYGLLLSSFSAKLLLRINKKAFYALIALIFLVNILRAFVTYNNVYILDLQDVIKDLSYRNPDDNIFVHSKERKRITFYERKDNTNEETELILKDVPDDLTFFYLKNSFFPNTLFCITPESFSRSLSSASKMQQTASDKRYARIGLLFKNKKHNSVISIYKHDPYIPHPVPDDGLDLLLEHCTLKAYIPEYDAFVYLSGNGLIWLIGSDEKIWVTFRLHFDSGELPDHPPASESDEERKWVDIGFMNNNSKQYKQIGKYHIFKKNIPADIKFGFISCAFNSGKGTIRTRKFTVSEDAVSQP